MSRRLSRRSALSLLGLGAAGTAWAAGLPAAASNTACFNVVDFGARGNGGDLDSPTIQQAIDRCSASGGIVMIPSGRYLCGTIRLRSRVALWLQPGATLLGSTDLAHYPPITPAFRSYTDVNYVERSLIYAEKAADISILGSGTIHGQGESKAFQLGGDRAFYKQRPFLIRMVECQRVTVRDVRLMNSAMWVQHYLACDDLLLDGISVDSVANANNDGIDLDCCRRVRVANCSIRSGDDALVFKSTAPRACEQVVVTNCVFSSHCNAIKCGTESTGDFRDICVSNCVIHDTRLSGIALEAVDGGTLDGVTLSNIRMRGARGGIFVRLGNRARPYLAEGPGYEGSFTAGPGLERPGVGKLRNVHISQVSGDGCDATGCAIAGLPGHPIENLTLHQIDLEFAGGGTAQDAARSVPEKESGYPEYGMFGQLPAYGFFARHVRGLRLFDSSVRFAAADERPGFVGEDVEGVELRGWGAQPPVGNQPEILVRDGRRVWIHGCRSVGEAGPFVRVEGASSRQIRLSDNEGVGTARAISRGEGVSADALETETSHQ